MTLKKFAINETVKGLLEKDPALRDSDEKLVVKIWEHQLSTFCGSLGAMDFFSMYSKGELTTADTITRCRRKLQQEIESLRGVSYHVRQGKETATAKAELREIKGVIKLEAAEKVVENLHVKNAKNEDSSNSDMIFKANLFD